MKIGLLSDTHDNTPAIALALAGFRRAGVAFVLHAGDVADPTTLAAFAGTRGAVVLGNGDVDARGLTRAAEALGWSVGATWTGDLGGLRVGMAHGHDRAALRRLVEDGAVDLVVTGHTHRVRDETVGGTRVVNPGALYRAARYTAAVFDTATRRLEQFDVPKGSGF